ncbi:uncharacterized protein N7446_008929 [Penicillium canescens]|uniref:Mannosyl phosphorylinositol ceramide synthase SUR1 n=1 Tax=Penicillium canescens TaxID=5083 RepID=A0AAD6NGI6_PENCN|nr:uncharacterized protein N7446_008929 [Penicillium canescens]KAJ6058030.1 hypothetical protein N7460_001304 [Penicillium canescens]KAJ6059346.1 hypothetical protein N7446_008929 [Penicillium canescens]
MSAKSQGNNEAHCKPTGYDEESLAKRPVLPFTSGWEPIKFWYRPMAVRKTSVFLLLFDLVVLGLLLAILHPLISLLLRNNELFGPRDIFPPGERTEVRNSTGRLIPRILHQTCANETIPAKWAEAHASCKNAYADFEYKLWTHERSREFIAANYPWFLNYWDNYAFNIQRADAIRYFVLYHFGGIYLDMDTICKEPIPFDHVESVNAPYTAVVRATIPTGVTNSFMISSAGHPAFKAAIHRLPIFYSITRFWAGLFPYWNVMMATGSMYVISLAQLESYIADLRTATWHGADATILLWLEDKPLVWFSLGGLGTICGLYVINCAILVVWMYIRRSVALPGNIKRQVKLA